jgi:hypothetical protein
LKLLVPLLLLALLLFLPQWQYSSPHARLSLEGAARVKGGFGNRTMGERVVMIQKIETPKQRVKKINTSIVFPLGAGNIRG